MYVLASRPFSANADKQQSISENMYLAHISRTCIPHVSIICFSVLTVGSIVLLERVTKWNKLEIKFLKTCISHVCLAHVSRMRVLVACVHTRVVTEIKSQIKIQV